MGRQTPGRRLGQEGKSGKLRILLVDDDAAFRAVATAIIEADGRGTVVGEAVDGTQAVWLLAALEPDVIMMDLRMPRMDGFAASNIVKQRYPQMQIVVRHGD